MKTSRKLIIWIKYQRISKSICRSENSRNHSQRKYFSPSKSICNWNRKESKNFRSIPIRVAYIKRRIESIHLYFNYHSIKRPTDHLKKFNIIRNINWWTALPVQEDIAWVEKCGFHCRSDAATDIYQKVYKIYGNII